MQIVRKIKASIEEEEILEAVRRHVALKNGVDLEQPGAAIERTSIVNLSSVPGMLHLRAVVEIVDTSQRFGEAAADQRVSMPTDGHDRTAGSLGLAPARPRRFL